MKTTFTPNVDCYLTKIVVDGANVYGEEQKIETRRKERCAVVKIIDEVQHTTVRADSGASRGHAEEFVTSNKILLAPDTKAALLDKLEVEGVSMRIISMFPRRDVMGKLHHYEVRGEAWA